MRFAVSNIEKYPIRFDTDLVLVGLNPKMTIWNTGAQAGVEGRGAEGSGMGGVESIRNMYQMLPPLMSTINEQ
jgi:hypothetical protein